MWKNMEDVQKSLFEYSHLEYPSSSPPVAPPISITEYRARTANISKPGLFDEQPESKEIFISGRGKHHPGTIIRPGQPVKSTPQEDMDIRRKIREVSGLGYSNELIERMYGQKETNSSDEEDDVLVLPDLKLKSTKSEPEESSTSSSTFDNMDEKYKSSWNTIVDADNESGKNQNQNHRKSRGVVRKLQKM